MGNSLGLLLSGLVAATGLAGVVWPAMFRSSLKDQYTDRRARLAGLVMLLLGPCGLWAILHDMGGGGEFFPV